MLSMTKAVRCVFPALVIVFALTSCGGGTRTVTVTTAVPAALSTVPLVTGLRESGAVAKIRTEGLLVRVLRRHNATVPKGFVYGQVPVAGAHVLARNLVTIDVSLGKR
jgi:beta-lactam-binding protein with PASTA domain